MRSTLLLLNTGRKHNLITVPVVWKISRTYATVPGPIDTSGKYSTLRSLAYPHIDKLNNFEDLPPPHCYIAADLILRNALDKFVPLRNLAERYPTHPAVNYHFGRALSGLIDYEGALESWDKVFAIITK